MSRRYQNASGSRKEARQMEAMILALLGLGVVWVLWPRKAERIVRVRWTAGETALLERGLEGLNIDIPGLGNCNMWVRTPEHVQDTVLFVVGFGHRPEHLANLVDAVPVINQVIILNLNVGVQHIGWLTISGKLHRIIAWVRHLILRDYIKGRQVIIEAHSMGGIYEEDLVARFPLRVGNIVLLGPVPQQQFGIARHPSYWIYAVGAVPSLLRSLVWGTGMLPPRWVARGLFTNESLTDSEFDRYYDGLVPDSGLAFLQMMFVYRGGAYQRARAAGWNGNIVVVAAGKDMVCRVRTLREMCPIVRARLRILEGMPHCFFVKPLDAHTRRVLQEALE